MTAYFTTPRFTTSPARAAIAGALLAIAAGHAMAAAPLQHRSATLECEARRIVVDADCFADGGRTLQCTRQTLRFLGAGGTALGARSFAPAPQRRSDDYPVVEAQFGTLACVEASTGEKLVTALMDNGGNCEQCEWMDVYTIDGKLLGSTRPGAAQPDIVRRIGQHGPKRVIGQADVGKMYWAQPPAAPAPPAPSAAAYACPIPSPAPARIGDADRERVTAALNAAFDAAVGPATGHLHEDKVFARVAASHLDDQRMAHLAAVTGCAALIDQQAGCAGYFDTEFGNPLSVFMSMKKSAPARRQFEEAVARLPDRHQRRAAQDCIKGTGSLPGAR